MVLLRDMLPTARGENDSSVERIEPLLTCMCFNHYLSDRSLADEEQAIGDISFFTQISPVIQDRIAHQ